MVSHHTVVMSYSIPWDERDEFPITISDASPSDGMNPFLTLFVEVSVRFPELCEALSEFDSVAVAPPEYHHITLKTIGEFDGDIEEIYSPLRERVEGIGSFEVEFTGVDVFPNCVYIPVEDSNDELQFLHEVARDIDTFSAGDFEGESYTPHTTIAKFREQPDEEVFEVLEEFRDADWGTAHIDSVHLVKDGTETVDVYPTFNSIEEISLD